MRDTLNLEVRKISLLILCEKIKKIIVFVLVLGYCMFYSFLLSHVLIFINNPYLTSLLSLLSLSLSLSLSFSLSLSLSLLSPPLSQNLS